MATNSFYRTPYLTTISFAVGILLFFLPFAAIKCNGNTLAEMTGKDMVTGSSPKMSSEFENMAKSFDTGGSTNKKTAKSEKGKVYELAIVALALGIGGLIVSLVKRKGYNKLEVLLGILGAIALIALMIQVKSDINSELESKNKNANEFSSMMKVSVDFTIWFFLSVLSFLSAAFFSYKQKELSTTQDVPSNAPQLKIENPGDQSNFPASPSGDKDLG